ncbi:MAG: DUF6265 family protein [Pseudomonadota bacterium]
MRAIGAFVAGAALAFGAPLAAKNGAEAQAETRAMPEGAESPPASADQLDWLVGEWAGPGVRGETAMESWTAPVGGTMVGTFIQTNADGSIMFTEHMYIRPVGESLEIAIKHFNPDLTGWEEKDEVERFRLVAIEQCAAYFQTLTIRCANKNAPDEGIIVAVRAGTDDAGKVKELVFLYRAQPDTTYSPDCTRFDTNFNRACFSKALDDAEVRYEELRQKVITIMNELEVDQASFDASEEAFVTYRDAECPNSDEPEDFLCRWRVTNQRIDALTVTWLVSLQP